MKYYYREHLLGYERVEAEGKTAWAEIHGEVGFDNFPSREFLKSALPRLSFAASPPAALEYGCGTGPGACFLAGKGFQVDAIDLIPTGIEIAKQVAKERNLDIRYEVQDICELPREGKAYDLIVDSYCLQCIVMDAEREKLFSTVRGRLRPNGYYVVSTAIFDQDGLRREQVHDEGTGIVYNRYRDNLLIDPKRGIVYLMLDERPEGYEPVARIGGTWCLPTRRHLTPPALKVELEAAHFRVLFQDGGNLICTNRESDAALLQ